jgi:TPR repeat protein
VSAADAAAHAPAWRAACEKNDASACGNLGAIYAQGKGVPQDYKQAEEFYEKACRFGQPLRCLRAGIFVTNGKGTEKSLDRAAELYGLGCKLFDPENCIAYYAITHGKIISLEGAMKPVAEFPKASPSLLQAVATSLTLACDRGMVNPCGNLGGLYEEGDAFPRDLVQALHFYERACELGEGERCARAGRFYANGQGVAASDKAKAEKLFQRSCDLKHTINCPMGEKARKGLPIDLTITGAPVITAAAVKESQPEMSHPPPFSANGIPAWSIEAPSDPIAETGLAPETASLVRACNHGDARACGNAASTFVNDAGQPTSHAELARRLYQKACSFGRAQRCADLAGFFRAGTGAPKDPGRAKAADKRACDLGRKESCAP